MSEELMKYNEIFVKIFNVEENNLPQLVYKDTIDWNSMAHIALVSSIEETFDVDFSMDDIYAFTSYEKGKQLLKSKFGIDFN